MCAISLFIQKDSVTDEEPRLYLSQGSLEDEVSTALSCLFLYCSDGQGQSVCFHGALRNFLFYSTVSSAP